MVKSWIEVTEAPHDSAERNLQVSSSEIETAGIISFGAVCTF